MRELRDDLRLASKAKELGWEVVYSNADSRNGRVELFLGGNVPCDCLVFKKGNLTVWYTSIGWRSARLVGDRYTGHKTEGYDLEKVLTNR